MGRSLSVIVAIALATSAGCAADYPSTQPSAAASGQGLASSLPTPGPTPVAALCDAARAVLKIADTPLTQLAAGMAGSRKFISAQDTAMLAMPALERPLLRDISRVRDALDFIEGGNNDGAAAYLSDARADVESHYQLSCQLPM